MKLIFFAIQHRPSGKFLAETKGSYTSEDPRWATRTPPRLWLTLEAAERSRTRYCQGQWIAQIEYAQDGWEGQEYSYRGAPRPLPNTSRNRDDFRVVEFICTAIA